MLMALESVMNQGIFYFTCWVVVDFFFVSPSVYISFLLARIVRGDRVKPYSAPIWRNRVPFFCLGHYVWTLSSPAWEAKQKLRQLHRSHSYQYLVATKAPQIP